MNAKLCSRQVNCIIKASCWQPPTPNTDSQPQSVSCSSFSFRTAEAQSVAGSCGCVPVIKES